MIRKERLRSLKHEKISIVKVIMISLIVIASLSVIRAVYFYHEMKSSMLEDIKREARVLSEYILITKKLSIKAKSSAIALDAFKNRNLYVKYVVADSLNEANRADEKELMLLHYFLQHKDKKEYFDEYRDEEKRSYQYAWPIYQDTHSKVEEHTLSTGKPQAMISIRISHDRAIKDLDGLILKEIVFSLMNMAMMILLFLFFYKDTEKRICKIDDKANKYAFTDALTGLYNRHYLDGFLQSFTPLPSSEKCFAVLFIDIDNFKNVNDKYGHIVGDCVLKALGRQLQTLTRGEDFLCRYGGEEFLIIISDISRTAVLQKAEYIRKSVDEMDFSCEKKKLTISLGISCGKKYDNIDMLIEQADKALYRAKRSGKNCIEIF